MNERIDALLVNSKKLPNISGIYKMLDDSGTCIYVGKAKNLKNRVSSYFKNVEAHTQKTQLMVASVATFEITVTENENEALILESNLIKSLHPRYNVLLRDDKSYPFVQLEEKHEYPRIKFFRGTRGKKGRYFGPFPNAHAVRETLNMLQKLFKIRQCDQSFFRNRTRACLQYQIDRCSGPCVGLIDKDDYRSDVEAAVMVLEGRNREVVDRLNSQMEKASSALKFEVAAKLRDQIRNLSGLQLAQTVDRQRGDVDVVAISLKAGVACVQVFFVRHGRVLGNKSYFPVNIKDTLSTEILEAFLKQFYLTGHKDRETPSSIIISESVTDVERLEAAIGEAAQHRVAIKTTVRGDRSNWLRMAKQNADLALNHRLSSSVDHVSRMGALSDILNKGEMIERIECFDISHLGGESTVASCVVFDKDGPNTSAYRKFNIKEAKAADDYAAINEAMIRRYSRVKSEGGVIPDVLVVDGGKGQITQAVEMLDELQISGVIVVGIAKGPSRKSGLERLLYSKGEDVKYFRPNLLALHLLQHARDEAHRFAVDAHRKSRVKGRRKSKLEDVEGIGAKRRRNLVRYFGGLQGIARAGMADLERVPGISKELAKRIHQAVRD